MDKKRWVHLSVGGSKIPPLPPGEVGLSGPDEGAPRYLKSDFEFRMTGTRDICHEI